ncbi:MAG: hypothetical protein CMQ54_00470 [Gammaproteobacteria bacterium]|nr:hypothetical protein [Gammaproteobacteria bacterium]|tara:strand:- start:539 stop:1192 length:654 start_codon:yes stop_codon:yes gene_type:complete
MKKSKKISFVLLIITAFFASQVSAVEKGDWIIRAGYTNINPISDNGDTVTVNDGSNFTAAFSYLLTNNIGVEILAGLPFEHDIYDKALGTGLKIGSTQHLPPTVTLQYYLNPTSNFRPYFGLGYNYTFFFKEKTKGPLQGASLDIGSSTGLVYQLGFDWRLNENFILNLDLRKFNLESTANVTNIANSSLVNDLPSSLEFNVPIDPVTLGVGLSFEF